MDRRRARIYRTIERSPRFFGLEPFDAMLWASSFMLLRIGFIVTVATSIFLWVSLFILRLRHPPGFLIAYLRFWARRLVCNNTFHAGREAARPAWLGRSK